MALPETPSRGVDLADPTTLIRLGYWHRAASMAAGPGDDPWPKPQDMVDEGWDASERPGAAGYLDRDGVASYLERGFIARAYMGLSPCRLCRQNNGCLELTDGTFLWSEGLAHYVRDHAVRLPDRFLEHIAEVADAIESADVEESWWKSLRKD